MVKRVDMTRERKQALATILTAAKSFLDLHASSMTGKQRREIEDALKIFSR